MTDDDRLAFYRWCKKNGSLEGLRYHSEAGPRGLLCSFPKRDVLGLKVRGRTLEIRLQELAKRIARKRFDQKGLRQLEKLLGKFQRGRSQAPTALHPSVSTKRRSPKVSGKAKLIDLVREHIGLLAEDSGRSIPQFLDKIGMPFLQETECASDLRSFREGYPLSSGITLSRPFDRAIPQVVDSLTGRLQDAARDWERGLECCDFERLLRDVPFVSEERRRDLVVSAAKSDEHVTPDTRDLFDLFDEHFDLLMSLKPNSCGPSVIGYAADLVGRSVTEKARRLVSLLLSSDTKGFKPLVEFFQFLVTAKPGLQGLTNFDELSPSDLFLAACYYDEKGPAKRTLEDIRSWSLQNLRVHLEDREWNDFLVRGAQPRIAEIALGWILKNLYQDKGASDLNLIEAENGTLEHPSEKRLPPADWKTSQGCHIDVKSNLFFRSKAEHVGLRGLMINRPDRKNVRWAGFIFHASSNSGCSWAYVGELSSRCLEEGFGGDFSAKRVLPFLFSFPDEFRWKCFIAERDAQDAANLILRPELLMGWCLASSAICGQAWRRHEPYSKVAVRFIEAYLREPPDLPFEFRLWRSLTEHSIAECSEGKSRDVEVLLGLVGAMLSAETAPLLLPHLGTGGETLFHRWCTEVLEPIRANFHKITCPKCKGQNFSLTVSRITAGGAIYGRMDCCDGCDLASEEITILTHCRECGSFPLVLGKNKMCEDCFGLICESDESESACGACKRGCPSSPQVESPVVVP